MATDGELDNAAHAPVSEPEPRVTLSLSSSPNDSDAMPRVIFVWKQVRKHCNKNLAARISHTLEPKERTKRVNKFNCLNEKASKNFW